MRSLLSPAQRQEVDWTEELGRSHHHRMPDWWLIHVTESGCAGPIELLAYWQTFNNGDASLLKLRALQHLETPGIGDFIDHRRNNYLPARDNLSVAEWQSMDTVSGATITHNALRQAATTVAQRLTAEAQARHCDTPTCPGKGVAS
ncbi:MAG: hypothetical protein CM15mP120_12430 [Pseudomonadota bacterium]|nr:MAG: hypothetical protein CM15mP120_12430 [Pseudomonadota bacterium]